MQEMSKDRRKPVDDGFKRSNDKLERRRKRNFASIKAKQRESKIEDIVAKYEGLAQTDFSACKSFRDFPLSSRTIKGLEESDFTCPTEIQRDSLPFSLTGVDLVGAAKTGSGKTLALIIPLLECLWRQRWSRKSDGLGALVISPTRELALQTFNTISKVGAHHDFSCALLMGGTDVEFEKRRLHSINIIVCTPGRLQQHLDENELFQCENLQMLIIDEADRILDMGFAAQINAIVENLPQDRQTLLFSATQTSDVKQLSRVCTKDPVMVSVHEKSVHATPEELRQNYLICKEEEKINLLWSFISHHKHKKTLVFVSSCKQARFLTEAFCHLRPGTSLMGLWGTMKQTKRLSVFDTFEKRKSACMIATDVASRGLDFSGVDWVVQMDTPATIDDYIHRVGRTARMNKKGSALMFLTENQIPSMKKMLAERKIPITETKHDPKSITNIRLKMQGVLAEFPLLKDQAQKYVVAYLRSVYLMSNKNIFNVDSIDAKALAESLGLAAIKRIRFLQKRREGKKLIVQEKQVFDGHDFGDEEKESDDSGEDEEEEEEEENEEGGSLFTVKKRDVFNVAGQVKQQQQEKEAVDAAAAKLESTLISRSKVVTKIKEAKAKLKKGIPLNEKIRFDEEGEEVERLGSKDGNWKAKGLDISTAIEKQSEQDLMDKKAWKEKQAAAKKEKKKKEKDRKKRAHGKEEDEVAIGGDSDEEGSVDLSWLPDPDKPKRFDDSNDDDEEDDDDDDDEEGYGGMRGIAGSSDEDEDDDEDSVRAPPAKRARNGRATADAESAALALLGVGR